MNISVDALFDKCSLAYTKTPCLSFHYSGGGVYLYRSVLSYNEIPLWQFESYDDIDTSNEGYLKIEYLYIIKGKVYLINSAVATYELYYAFENLKNKVERKKDIFNTIKDFTDGSYETINL